MCLRLQQRSGGAKESRDNLSGSHMLTCKQNELYGKHWVSCGHTGGVHLQLVDSAGSCIQHQQLLVALGFGHAYCTCHLSRLVLCRYTVSLGKASTLLGELMVGSKVLHVHYVCFCVVRDTLWSVSQELVKVPQELKADQD